MTLEQELPLISTIAVGFTVAFIFGMLAHKLRLSPIVGYLLAGVLIGPFTPGFIADGHLAEQLSEIGILLLMFGVGLHFSVRDLMSVKKIALPGALTEITVITSLGCVVGAYLWGWTIAEGLIFGLALSVASTVVLLRALEEHNILRTNNGNIAVGWLIVEDLFMVLALVFIPVLSGKMAGGDSLSVTSNILWALGKVVFFIVFMLVVGKRFLPWLLEVVSDTRSRELFTLSVFTVAIGVAFASAKMFGISLALGAFFAGMMLKESRLAHEVAEKALPLQDAFAVLFFVSVGMLFDPSIIIEKPLPILGVVGIIMIGKSMTCFMIITMFRYPLKTALTVAGGLAQIGEFSFILVGLGSDYGLISSTARDLILAGALISISLNPFMFRFMTKLYPILSAHPKIKNFFSDKGDELSHLKKLEKRDLKHSVILVGHGRVGKHISSNLQSAKMNLVIIDANRERIEGLREQGFHAIAGNGTSPETLHAAGLEDAVAIIIAIPNPFEARGVTETARKMKPNIKILARAHNDEEMEYFTQQNIDLSVMGTREVANKMVHYLQNEL